ncbi:MAG: recombinase family protein [Oscillospiraceae bacterium]|nr:recombinase family protein [Oscillospiraceae bacterium]
MKAVIYARYSSDNQREESIEGQIRECSDFANKNGMTVVHTYIDRAYSAKTDNRPSFQEMIRDSNRKGFDVVIVWKLDRFSRNRYDSARYKAVLKRNGVKLISATEKISEGSEGIILEAVLEGFAEYYSADLSEKVTRGMTENVLKGKFNGGNLTLGYSLDSEHNIVIDETIAPFIRKAFKMYANGSKTKDIIDYLNSYGLTNGRGKPMNYDSVRRILRNRRYIGEYTLNEVIGTIPAIISKDLFYQVQTLLTKNQHAQARGKAVEEYLLTTKLFCGHCGAMMRGESGTSSTGTIYRYYKCASVKDRKQNCPQTPIPKEYIEDLVIRHLVELLSDDATIEAIANAVFAYQETHQNHELVLLESQQKDVSFRLSNMLANLELGINSPSVLARIQELEDSKTKIEAQIEKEKQDNPSLSKEQVLYFLHSLRPTDITDISQRRTLINTLLNHAVLYDDTLEIFSNYSNHSKSLPLKTNTRSNSVEPSSPKKALERK